MAKRKITRGGNLGKPLKQAFDEFIAEKEVSNITQATISNYLVSYRLFTEFSGYTADTTTDEVSISTVHTFIRTLKQTEVAETSINHYLRDIRVFLYWCMKDERAYIPPFKVTTISTQEEQLKLFTDAELERLLKKPTKDDPFTTWRTWVMVNWVLGTGNRASTICDVHLNDIDYTSKEIALRHTKNKRTQIIPLSPTLETVLKEYIRMWRYGADGDKFLFPNVCDEKLTTNALRQAFTDYCHSREVTKTNIHGLRHNFAKGWLRNGGNMFVLQRVLGHSTLEMTKKYVRLFSEDMKLNYDRYSPLDTINRATKRTVLIKKTK